MATSRDWQRLGALVSERRGDLGLTQEDVRAAGGPSTATQRLIEGAHQSRYQPVILARLEAALGWQPGSVRRILAGGEPVPVSAAPAAVPLAAAPEPPAEPAADAEVNAQVLSLLFRRKKQDVEAGVRAEIRAAKAAYKRRPLEEIPEEGTEPGDTGLPASAIPGFDRWERIIWDMADTYTEDERAAMIIRSRAALEADRPAPRARRAG